MIILDTQTKTLEIFLGGAVSTNQLPVVATYVDVTTTAFSPGSSDADTNSATDVTIVAAPGASTQRQVKFISVKNEDTAAATVTIQLNNNGTDRIIVEITLAVNSTLLYTDGEGFRVINTSGEIVSSATAAAHATSHENGGSDEVSVTALSGLLADDQHVIDAEVLAVAISKTLMTTRGDIIFRNATVPARLAKGDVDDVLTMGTDDPAWAAPVAGFTPGRLTVPIVQFFPATGTAQSSPENTNDNNTATNTATGLNQYSEIALIAPMTITQYRFYGVGSQNADGVWKIQYLNSSFSWTDWVTGISTRVDSWSNWDSGGGSVTAYGIRWECTTVDSSGWNRVGELEVKY